MHRADAENRGAVERAARLAAGAVLFASAAIACASAGATRQPTLPSGLPVPPNAVLGIGRDGPGVDEGHPFYTYSYDLAPDDALMSYSGQLTAAGFMAEGMHGSWHVFSRGDVQISVRIGNQGPPTTIYVRIDTESIGGPDSGGNGKPNGSHEPNGSGPDPSASHGNQGGNGPDGGTGSGGGADPNNGQTGGQAGGQNGGGPNGTNRPDASNAPDPNASKAPNASRDPGHTGSPPSTRPDHPTPRPTAPPKPPPPHGGG